MKFPMLMLVTALLASSPSLCQAAAMGSMGIRWALFPLGGNVGPTTFVPLSRSDVRVSEDHMVLRNEIIVSGASSVDISENDSFVSEPPPGPFAFFQAAGRAYGVTATSSGGGSAVGRITHLTHIVITNESGVDFDRATFSLLRSLSSSPGANIRGDFVTMDGALLESNFEPSITDIENGRYRYVCDESLRPMAGCETLLESNFEGVGPGRPWLNGEDIEFWIGVNIEVRAVSVAEPQSLALSFLAALACLIAKATGRLPQAYPRA